MPTALSADKIFEKMAALRRLNSGGYRHSGSGFLRPIVFSKIRYGPQEGATTYPAAATLSALCWALESDAYTPAMPDGAPLPSAFLGEWLGMSQSGGPVAAVLRHKLGRVVKLERLRRGDLINIAWKGRAFSGLPHHVAFVFDAAFDRDGKTQAVQLLSAHGRGDQGPGISVALPDDELGDWLSGKPGSFAPRSEEPFADRELFEKRGLWFSWRNPEELELMDGGFLVESGRLARPARVIPTLHPARSLAARFGDDLPAVALPADVFTYHHSTKAELADAKDVKKAETNKESRHELAMELSVTEKKPEAHPQAASTQTRQLNADKVPLASHRQVQRQLSSLGRLGAIKLAPLKEDGFLGPKTRNAVRVFQKAHGLKSDGLAGPLTRRRLSEALLEARQKNTRSVVPPEPVSKPRFVAARWSRSFVAADAAGLAIFASTVAAPDGTTVVAEVFRVDEREAVLNAAAKVARGKATFTFSPRKLAELGGRFRFEIHGPKMETFRDELALELLPPSAKRAGKWGPRLAAEARKLHGQKPKRFLFETPVPWGGEDSDREGPADKSGLFLCEVYGRVFGRKAIEGVLGALVPIAGRRELVPFPPSQYRWEDPVELELEAKWKGDRRHLLAAYKRLAGRFKAMRRRFERELLDGESLEPVAPGDLLVWPVPSPEFVGRACVVTSVDTRESEVWVVEAHPDKALVAHGLSQDDLKDILRLRWALR